MSDKVVIKVLKLPFNTEGGSESFPVLPPPSPPLPYLNKIFPLLGAFPATHTLLPLNLQLGSLWVCLISCQEVRTAWAESLGLQCHPGHLRTPSAT